MSKRQTTSASTRPSIRCAIYCRKSTTEGLDAEFSSLDAQRECGEAYIKSQAHEGWVCLPEHYDDGGFSGGSLDRPALQRLLADIAAGKVDFVVCYKYDRLSRSMLDFARMMELFDKQHVGFVAVTQSFNTTTSIGRLMQNMILSFAQFERELIAERTRDKIGAARRKGRWSGGHPLLGYDVNEQTKLVINDNEAQRVRTIFDFYLEHQALLPVVQELHRRGWVTKRWTTRKGQERGGQRFDKTTLYRLLTNVAYLGKVRHKADVFEGEHEAIVDQATWQKVQSLLARNGRAGGTAARNKHGALLKGLIHCLPCGCAMTPSHSLKNGNLRYRYYTCTAAQKRGWQTCPSKSIPGGQIEQFVVEQIKQVGRDPALLHETIAQTQVQCQARAKELEAERHGLEREITHWHQEVRDVATKMTPGQGDSRDLSRLADLQERIRSAEQRLTAIRDEQNVLDRAALHEDEIAQALREFDPLWQALRPKEQARVLQLLIERVDYDGAKQTVKLTFHPTGIKTLAAESTLRRKEIA